MSSASQSEQCDVVVVGARVSGSATSIEAAKRGSSVVALDAATFPSDTLSTHLIFPGCVAQLKELGALDNLLRSGTPTMDRTLVNHGGRNAHGTYSPVQGINYAICPRRTSLDHALVEQARSAGADVREATKVTGLLWDAGRVVGVRWRDRGGDTGEITAKLVVGADGRRSTIAGLVGAGEPYRRAENGRGLVFMYVDDPGVGVERSTIYQWRVDDTLAMYFPTDDHAGLVLLMGPREDVGNYGANLDKWNKKIAEFPALVERIGGGEPRTRLRKAADTYSYFRRASGPGWALVGDAAQFKDPVIAQGIHDGIVYGRRLGRIAAETIDCAERTDAALYDWELRRDRECLSAYYWGLRLTDTAAITPLEMEAFKTLASDPGITREWMDVYSRRRRVEQFMTYRRQVAWFGRAVRGGARPRQTLRQAALMTRTDLDRRRDELRLRRGRRIGVAVSDPWVGAADGTPA